MKLEVHKSYECINGHKTSTMYPFENADCGFFYCAAGLDVRLYSSDGRCLSAKPGDDGYDIKEQP